LSGQSRIEVARCALGDCTRVGGDGLEAAGAPDGGEAVPQRRDRQERGRAVLQADRPVAPPAGYEGGAGLAMQAVVSKATEPPNIRCTANRLNEPRMHTAKGAVGHDKDDRLTWSHVATIQSHCMHQLRRSALGQHRHMPSLPERVDPFEDGLHMMSKRRSDVPSGCRASASPPNLPLSPHVNRRNP